MCFHPPIVHSQYFDARFNNNRLTSEIEVLMLSQDFEGSFNNNGVTNKIDVIW
jgi:hypothetical protein